MKKTVRLSSLLILIAFSWASYADDSSLYKQIEGHWQAVSIKQNGKEISINNTNPASGAAEFYFKSNNKILIRAIDPMFIETKALKEYSGIYRIKDGQLYMQLNMGNPDSEENQKIQIKDNLLILEPVEYKGLVSNTFRKIPTWTLKL
ncbi:hypothetical protein A3762_09840 [Oleiphilus sp. HI0125]|uniref:hypothetical protein n=1 Tax=Oleiphilus sp. HI0125 TaxID=1822266 RepID=UPI0007C2507B|nr:hypothetical protein [Oleiphilus sp. HI0125]KZZ57531.1 hypothetical protein A3762_09840 [Oleiphilus sp. HI0125]